MLPETIMGVVVETRVAEARAMQRILALKAEDSSITLVRKAIEVCLVVHHPAVWQLALLTLAGRSSLRVLERKRPRTYARVVHRAVLPVFMLSPCRQFAIALQSLCHFKGVDRLRLRVHHRP